MKMSKLCGFAVLLSAGVFHAAAQEAASPTPRPTPPAPPFVNETPSFSAWTIARYNIAGAGSQTVDGVVRSLIGAAKPESLTTVKKTGQIRHQSRKLKTGEQEDIWYERGNRVTMESIWKIPLFEGNTSGVKQPQGPDFPEMYWISAENFVGTQQYQSANYFVFETQVTEGDSTKAKAYGYTLHSAFNRAYINADTRLPWFHQVGDVVELYAFQAAPTAPLEVPAEYQAMFDNFEKRKVDAARKPIAP